MPSFILGLPVIKVGPAAAAFASLSIKATALRPAAALKKSLLWIFMGLQQRSKMLSASEVQSALEGAQSAFHPIGMSEEIFDVVNERDEVSGGERRSEVHRTGLKHRAVHVL